MPDLTTMLAEKLEKINKIPYINSGGCGVVAHAAYTYIRRNSKLRPRIMYLLDDDDLDYQNGTCAHAVLYFDPHHCYDSEGVHTLAELINKWEIVDTTFVHPKTVMKRLKDEDLWNPCFKRNYQAKKINKIFNLDVDYTY